jgi:hypothetical protein
MLKASSWRVSVLIQTKRRIDRRCPHSDRRIIRCYCLRCSSSATRPTHLEIGQSVHPTVPRVSTSVPTRPTIAPTLAIWYRQFIRRCLFPFFRRVFNLDLCFNLKYLTYLTCHYSRSSPRGGVLQSGKMARNSPPARRGEALGVAAASSERRRLCLARIDETTRSNGVRST